jgi:hypothetical protein
VTFPQGTERYRADEDPVVARGLEFSEGDLSTEARGAVVDVMQDAPGRAEDSAFLETLDGTGFAEQLVDDVLSSADVDAAVLEEWRIGEAIAQAELEANRSCLFPWNARRDLKNPRASQAGAELVGFHSRPGTTACFGFGEVKTSSEDRYPPSVTTDLRRQVATIRDDAVVRHNLIRYLTARARAASWKPVFQEAWSALNQDRGNFAIFGVLVRDVGPDARDLRGMAEDFASTIHAPTSLELRALYVPSGCIGALIDEDAGS